MVTFYSEKELESIGLKRYGKNVLISKNAILYNPEKLSIGNNVRIDDYTIIGGAVTIGDFVHIAQFCGLYGGEKGIILEDFTGVSSKVSIYATSSDYSGDSLTNPTVPEKYAIKDKNDLVILKKHAIIGSGSVVLPGVKIGLGCSVGAMSLVTKDLDDWGIYVGIPVKRIKERNKNLLFLEKQLRDEVKSK